MCSAISDNQAPVIRSVHVLAFVAPPVRPSEPQSRKMYVTFVYPAAQEVLIARFARFTQIMYRVDSIALTTFLMLQSRVHHGPCTKNAVATSPHRACGCPPTDRRTCFAALVRTDSGVLRLRKCGNQARKIGWRAQTHDAHHKAAH